MSFLAAANIIIMILTIVISIMYTQFSEVQLSPFELVTTVTEGDNAMVCVRVSNGSLQRDIQVILKSISGPTSTGKI